MPHHNSNRNVFDEWVFNCQSTRPFTAQSRKQAESFRTSLSVSLLKAHNTGSISKIFLIFSEQHRWIHVLSDICTPPYLRFVRM